VSDFAEQLSIEFAEETQDILESKMTMLQNRVAKETFREAAELVRDFAKHYPESVFIPPPPGEHGNTVDACSAAAIRAILPTIAAALEKRAGE